MHNEHSLIAAFVKRSKRDRYRDMISSPRLRHKFTDQLAHFADFDPRYRLPIPSNKLFVDNIAFELQKPQGSHQKRPTVVTSKPANGSWLGTRLFYSAAS